MNILVINWRCMKNPEAGGAEVHLHEIFKRLAARGHNITLAAHWFRGAAREESIDGMRVVRIGNKYLFDQQFKRYYLRHLAGQPYDLVVDDISKIPLNTPNYIEKPLAGIIHHFHGRTLFRELSWPLAWYIYRKERAIPRIYQDTPIFAVSPSTREELIRLGQPENKTELLYNAIDHSLFERVDSSKTASPVICYIGRIKKYKNLETIIEALPAIRSEIPEIRFEIGGRGDHLEQLKRLVSAKGLEEAVCFLGYIPEERKAAAMGRAWLFITMAQKEGWGITVLEANAAGTPVIGSDVPGLRDSIVDGKTGLLVPYGDSGALARAVTALLTDRKRLEQMTAEARRWAATYTWDATADHFLACVRQWYPSLAG